MTSKKSALVATRIPPDLRARLDASNLRHGTTDSTIVLRLITAYLNEVEARDAVRWPVQITMAEPRLMLAAEDAGKYSVGDVERAINAELSQVGAMIATPKSPVRKSRRSGGTARA